MSPMPGLRQKAVSMVRLVCPSQHLPPQPYRHLVPCRKATSHRVRNSQADDGTKLERVGSRHGAAYDELLVRRRLFICP